MKDSRVLAHWDFCLCRLRDSLHVCSLRIMHCRSFNFKEPTSPPLHWSCAPKKLEQPSSSLACTPHTISQLQKACVATRLSSNAVMYVWWISSDPLKYALESLRSEVPGIQKSILNRELRKLKNWKCSAFSSPFLPILARFSSTSRERSVSKDSGIWLTDFVLSLSLFLLNVKWPQRQYKLREQRMFQNGIYCSQATVSLFSHTTGTEARKERIKQ